LDDSEEEVEEEHVDSELLPPLATVMSLPGAVTPPGGRSDAVGVQVLLVTVGSAHHFQCVFRR
jgi:hypothetical protein